MEAIIFVIIASLILLISMICVIRHDHPEDPLYGMHWRILEKESVSNQNGN